MKANIMRLDYTVDYGEVKQDMVALFDADDLTHDEAMDFIRADAYDRRIVTMTLNQFETVFRSLQTGNS